MDAVDNSGDLDHAARICAATAFLAEGRAQAFRDETNQPTKIIYETTWYRPRRETEETPNAPRSSGRP
jgi:hypothetical protein